jgi:hypothetical protein
MIIIMGATTMIENIYLNRGGFCGMKTNAEQMLRNPDIHRQVMLL